MHNHDGSIPLTQCNKKKQANFEHKTRVRHGASTLQTHLYIYIHTIYNECMQYNSTTHVIDDTLLSIYIYTHHLQRVYVVQQYNSCHRGYTFLLKCLYQARKVRRYVFVLRVSILILSTIFLLDFGTVSTMWYFLFFVHWLSNF